MTLAGLLIFLLIVGIILGNVSIEPQIKRLIVVGVIILAILAVAAAFGLIPGPTWIQLR
jgi:hypothetical protein